MYSDAPQSAGMKSLKFRTHSSGVQTFYRCILVSLNLASNEVSVIYYRLVTKKLNLFHSLMPRPNTKLHQNTVSNLGEETCGLQTGLIMIQHTVYGTFHSCTAQQMQSVTHVLYYEHRRVFSHFCDHLQDVQYEYQQYNKSCA
jgi:hypothetical protein